MRERGADAADLARLLTRICDEDVARLRGAVAAVNGLSDTTFGAAEDAATLGSEHIGLRWVLEQADAAVAELSERLQEAHRLAREQAGGTLPPTP
jgi:hypothetical protein